MRRILTVLIAGTIMLGFAPQATAAVGHPGAEWRERFCRYQSVEVGYWTPREVHLTIHCAIHHWPVLHSIADYVANRESSMAWFATNPTSGACGIYQHIPRYWPSRLGTFLRNHPRWKLADQDRRDGDGCYNARSNVIVSIHMAYAYGWGPWGM